MNDIIIAFHEKYYDALHGRVVRVFVKGDIVVEGIFANEFYEEESILITPESNAVTIIKISDIESMELAEND